jgi:PAS domain S-box-containing protein
VEIGLEQRFTSLALSRLRTGIVRSIHEDWRGTREELAAAMQSLHKLIDLEHALIQDAYEYEHVRRERQLERARGERQFRHLVESASCLIMILGPDHSVVYFNPFAERATGFRVTELPQREGGVLSILGRDRSETTERINAVMDGGAPVSYEDQVSGGGGPPRWINWTLSRIDEFDEGTAVLAVGLDVTEQKQAAQELLQANRLATIGEMYARLAHESRNALQRLRVCTEMLADHVYDRPPAVALLDRAHGAQEDLQRLLDEVRNFASPMALERTDCRLPALWREAWNLLQASRHGREAELNEDQCDLPLVVHADRFRMVQAFRNIFENTLAACSDPVVINVQCSESMLESQPAVEIVVEDNGPGFNDTALHKAFEPFFTTKSAGTGLGLAIVRRIVEAHGGRIEASGAHPGGARICMTLPYRLSRTK